MAKCQRATRFNCGAGAAWIAVDTGSCYASLNAVRNHHLRRPFSFRQILLQVHT
jgi:hypothetical protein